MKATRGRRQFNVLLADTGQLTDKLISSTISVRMPADVDAVSIRLVG